MRILIQLLLNWLNWTLIKIKTNVSNPEEVGTDRLVNSLAAWKKYNSATIIIDFGTATTFDIIDRKGVYLGGVIAPGINLSLEALHMAAARLPRIAITKPKKVIGNSTITAMQSGVYWGYVSLIEGIINRIIIIFINITNLTLFFALLINISGIRLISEYLITPSLCFPK